MPTVYFIYVTITFRKVMYLLITSGFQSLVIPNIYKIMGFSYILIILMKPVFVL